MMTGVPKSPPGNLMTPGGSISVAINKRSFGNDSVIGGIIASDSKIRDTNISNKGLRTIDELMAKLRESKDQNIQLKKEVITLKRIQNEQSRALNKMVHENDYPSKIRFLTDDLRAVKDRNKEYQGEIMRISRMANEYQAIMIEQTQTIRTMR